MRMGVSIHAPVWGATLGHQRVSARRLVSIHAPVWGATAVLEDQRPASTVSIHAPVWGATTFSKQLWRNIMFQSTRPYGARPDG